MKPILVIAVNVFLIYYFVMVLVDSAFWPDSNILKVRNLLFGAAGIYLIVNLASIYWFKSIPAEKGAVYRGVDYLMNVYQVSATYIQPFKREFIISILVSAALMFLGLVTIGIPGAFLLEIPKWLGLVKGLQGDSSWPAAILVSLVWPLFIPIGVIVKYELANRGSMVLAKVSLWGTILIGMLFIVSLVYLVNSLSNKN